MAYTLMVTNRAGREMGRVGVTRGKVTCVTPGFAWATGVGLHVVLAWCFKNQMRWQRVKSPDVQLELAL